MILLPMRVNAHFGKERFGKGRSGWERTGEERLAEEWNGMVR